MLIRAIIASLTLLTVVTAAEAQVIALPAPFSLPTTSICNTTAQLTTPQGLKVDPGDSTATISWLKPANDACVDFYNVSWAQIGPKGEKGALFQVKTPENGLTLTNLDNGVQYAFYVEAVYAQVNRTRPALITTIPQSQCDTTLAPTQPTNLTAYSDGPGIKICWKAPKGNGCVSEYRVARRLFPLTEEEARSVQWEYIQAKTAGCMTLGNLLDRRTYQLAVQSYSSSAKSGGYASTQATVVQDWKCMPVPSFYPLCAAAKSGSCNPMTCLDQLNAKRCDSPWLRRLDRTTKTVVQYCSELCGCLLDDLLGVNDSFLLKADDQSMDDHSFFDAANGCCKW